MKIGYTGLEIPEGKIKYNDEKLDSLVYKDKPEKITPYFVEFIKDEYISTEAIVISKYNLLDLLILDIEKIENRLNRVINQNEKKLLSKCLNILEDEKPLNTIDLNENEKKVILELAPHSFKPVIISDNDFDINSIIKETIKKAGYMFFYTTGKSESRGWLTKINSNIVTCASKIHSDLARGFIKGDVVSFEDYMKHYNFKECKSKGISKIVDKDYIVQNGEIIEIRFNV